MAGHDAFKPPAELITMHLRLSHSVYSISGLLKRPKQVLHDVLRPVRLVRRSNRRKPV